MPVYTEPVPAAADEPSKTPAGAVSRVPVCGAALHSASDDRLCPTERDLGERRQRSGCRLCDRVCVFRGRDRQYLCPLVKNRKAFQKDSASDAVSPEYESSIVDVVELHPDMIRVAAIIGKRYFAFIVISSFFLSVNLNSHHRLISPARR